MPSSDLPFSSPSAVQRHGDGAALAQALGEARDRTLAMFDAWAAVLPPDLEIRYAPELNPPRWELGHIAWFEEFWLSRHPERFKGPQARPDSARSASILAGGDAFYDSSHVAHARRWHLDLPGVAPLKRDAARIRERTLALLADLPRDDDPDRVLYLPRWVLAHEDMHAEAAVYMAQSLALPVGPAVRQLTGATGPAQAPADPEGRETLECPAATVTLGQAPGTLQGFAFDNELGTLEVDVPALSIDRAPVTWGRYLPFIEDGGYDRKELWTPAGWAWRQRAATLGVVAPMSRPRHLGREDGAWCVARFGQWEPLDPEAPAVHLTCHEAEAWCRWAGRRLPTEAEWVHAARQGGDAFAWGQVWEWTASRFEPFPGFEPHAYRDYSAPWFDGRPVLRGASFATAPRLRDLRYRNYFPAERNDIHAGFRSCAA
jgi:iron(II)-dependent oxidoreductase